MERALGVGIIGMGWMGTVHTPAKPFSHKLLCLDYRLMRRAVGTEPGLCLFGRLRSALLDCKSTEETSGLDRGPPSHGRKADKEHDRGNQKIADSRRGNRCGPAGQSTITANARRSAERKPMVS